MAGPHSEPSSIGMFVDDTIFVDELANKSPAELQAIGLNKLRTRCLISFTNTCFCYLPILVYIVLNIVLNYTKPFCVNSKQF